jgi:hypothetical protein
MEPTIPCLFWPLQWPKNRFLWTPSDHVYAAAAAHEVQSLDCVTDARSYRSHIRQGPAVNGAGEVTASLIVISNKPILV